MRFSKRRGTRGRKRTSKRRSLRRGGKGFSVARGGIRL